MDYKGVAIVCIRSALRNAGPVAEQSVLMQMSESERREYDDATASQWVSIAFATRLFELAAPVLYPGKPLALRQIGRDIARDNMRGVYRVFLRVVSPTFLLEQTARVWSTYHRHGKAHIEHHSDREVTLVVEGYPQLPERMREGICGWIAEALELTGAKHVIVSRQDDEPDAWKWRTRWQ